MTTSSCSSCGAPGTGRFCAQCGTPLVGGSLVAREKRGWQVAAGAVVLVLVILGLVVLRQPPAPAAAAAAPAGQSAEGTPPDLSSMTPRERFDRLYKRVMGAAESGDSVTVARFAPMVFAAYQQLDTVDADARYHAALLQVHSGDMAGPSALADTILARQPGHLFGYIVRGTVARWQKDEAALHRAYTGFLEHYDAEMRAARPEYGEHRSSVDEFHRQAVTARSSRTGT